MSKPRTFSLRHIQKVPSQNSAPWAGGAVRSLFLEDTFDLIAHRQIEKLKSDLNEFVDAIAEQYSGGRAALKRAARRRAIDDVLQRCPTPTLRKVFQALLPKPPGAPRKQKALLNKSEEKMLAALRLVNLHDAYMAEYPVSKEKQFLQWFLSSPLRGHLRTADAVRMKLKRAREIYGSVKVQTAGALRFLITNKI